MSARCLQQGRAWEMGLWNFGKRHEEYFKLQFADWNRDLSEKLIVVLELFKVTIANSEDR
jgi:hypothetical protein